MPSKPLRPCRHPGCTRLVPDGYCAEHRPAPADRGEESKAWRWMYRTAAWKSLRSEQLLAEPWCRECARQGRRVRATDVDHIRDHKGDWGLFTDRSNLQSLCHSCHSRKTLADMRKNRRF
jgi:5-methylcytosine-specific restriction protein A